jgi:hypothetical protein
MKTVLLLALMLSGSFANAETVIAEEFTDALLDYRKCDIKKIPQVARAAVDAALKKANEVCLNPEILSARILSIEPQSCHGWTPGFNAKAELEFRCSQNLPNTDKDDCFNDCGRSCLEKPIFCGTW